MPTSLPISNSKQSQVLQQRDELVSVIETVEKVLTGLEERLASVLRGGSTKADSKNELRAELTDNVKLIILNHEKEF